ncbi:hypothetical protein DVA67_011900 [Solirubrobacter sp. CPCC 204708]|nr:hypothetical protein [Solirubrobacter deserti]
MFEYHGWATILDSTGEQEFDEDPSRTTLNAVRNAMANSGLGNRVALDVRNGLWFLAIHGFNNHRNPAVVELFEAVARIAPGSYGILFTHDDEAGLRNFVAGPYEAGEHENWWYCRVMKRGRVERHADALLSPHVPTVEDDLSNSA